MKVCVYVKRREQRAAGAVKSRPPLWVFFPFEPDACKLLSERNISTAQNICTEPFTHTGADAQRKKDGKLCVTCL